MDICVRLMMFFQQNQDRRPKMKRGVTIALLLLFLIAPIALIAQSAKDLGLVLKGSSESGCKVVSTTEGIISCYKLRMVFENQGKEPVIIINPTLSFGTGLKEIVYYFDGKWNPEARKYGDEQEAGRRTVPTEPDKLESLKAIAQLLDGPRPPENLMIVVKPGETYTFSENFEMTDEYKLKRPSVFTRVDPITGKEAKITESHGWDEPPRAYRLIYEFSFLSSADDPDFLEKLNQRWKSFGTLPIGASGIYTITSERIVY
jgi:hypothetical protein